MLVVHVDRHAASKCFFHCLAVGVGIFTFKSVDHNDCEIEPYTKCIVLCILLTL